MKRYFCVLILLIFCNLIEAKKPKLISTKRSSDNSKDCRVIGDCVSGKYIKNDTLHLTIYFNNDCQDLSDFRNSFNFHNDTLNMKLEDPRIFEQKKPKRNKNGVWVYNIDISRSPCIGGHDIQKLEYKLIGFKNIPKIVELNQDHLCDCPTKPVKFVLYKNDTINVVNANGQMDGLWLEFHKNGTISEQRYYNNGLFVKGTTFDKNGKNLHFVGWTADDIMGVYSDTLSH